MPPNPYKSDYPYVNAEKQQEKDYNSDEAYIERLEKHFAAYKKNHQWTGYTVHPILMRVKYGPHYDPKRGTPNEVRDRLAYEHAVAQHHRTPTLGPGIDDVLQDGDADLSKEYSADRGLQLERILQMLNVDIAGSVALNVTKGRDHDLPGHPKSFMPPEHVESYKDISSPFWSSEQAQEGGVPLRHEFMHRREQHSHALDPLPEQKDPNFGDRSDPGLAKKEDKLYTDVDMRPKRCGPGSYENARLDPVSGVRYELARPLGSVKQPALDLSLDEKLKLSIDEIRHSFNTSMNDLRKNFNAKLTFLTDSQDLEKWKLEKTKLESENKRKDELLQCNEAIMEIYKRQVARLRNELKDCQEESNARIQALEKELEALR